MRLSDWSSDVCSSDLDPRSPATARFIVQDLVDVDEQARAAVIAVRDRRDGEPAENADAPRDREHEPAARPDAVQGHPEFIVEAVHRSKSILGRWVRSDKRRVG